MNKKIELLSPAGNFECAIAGFSYGADAIYLGLKNFSARADAMNFSDEELFKIVNYAHQNNKKVYVAINTVVQNSELDEVVKKLDSVNASGADAIIVQDLGVANIIKQYFPKIEMHASTQMAVHNLEGAIALKNLGFTRVVLARELTLSEIENITKNCGIETEVFIHGALCYSYSGLCMYSSFLKGESANRGKCTYPCRKNYDGRRPYSMKDLCLEEKILKLRDVGVSSLKIEGRKKTPLYVAGTTDYYRKILDGKDVSNLLNNIKRIFARPFTNLHFNGKNKDVIDSEFSGPRGALCGEIIKVKNNIITFKTNFNLEKHDGLLIPIKGIEKPFGFAIDVIKANGKKTFIAQKGDVVDISIPSNAPEIKIGMEVFSSSASEVKSRYPYNMPNLEKLKTFEPIDITLSMYKDKIVVLSSIDNESVEEVLNGEFDVAQNLQKMKESAKIAFEKLGGTSFILNKFNYENEGVFVPISILNTIRRNLIEKLEKIKSNRKRNIPSLKNFDNSSIKNSKTILKIDNVKYLDYFEKTDIEKIDEFLIDIDADIANLSPLIEKDSVRIALPVIVRNRAMGKLKNRLKDLVNLGYKKFEISNISGVEIMKEFNISDWTCDYHIYALNNMSIDFLLNIGAKRITLSVEDNWKNMNSVIEKFADKVCVIAYQDTPLFISDSCDGKCEICGKDKNTIVKNCRKFVLFEKPFCIVEKLGDLSKPAFLRYDFCFKKYDEKEVIKIFRNLLKNKINQNHTMANFERGFK